MEDLGSRGRQHDHNHHVIRLQRTIIISHVQASTNPIHQMHNRHHCVPHAQHTHQPITYRPRGVKPSKGNAHDDGNANDDGDDLEYPHHQQQNHYADDDDCYCGDSGDDEHDAAADYDKDSHVNSEHAQHTDSRKKKAT